MSISTATHFNIILRHWKGLFTNVIGCQSLSRSLRNNMSLCYHNAGSPLRLNGYVCTQLYRRQSPTRDLSTESLLFCLCACCWDATLGIEQQTGRYLWEVFIRFEPKKQTAKQASCLQWHVLTRCGRVITWCWFSICSSLLLHVLMWTRAQSKGTSYCVSAPLRILQTYCT